MVSPQFSEPTKCIFEGSDLPLFRKSVAYKRLHQAIAAIIEKVQGVDVVSGTLDLSLVTRQAVGSNQESRPIAPKFEKSLSTEYTPAVSTVLSALEALDRILDETPPLEGPRRFGNMACRDWHDKIEAVAGSLLQDLSSNKGLVGELEYYLVNSFGSAVRLDYGSGHELSFVAFVGGMMEYRIVDIQKTPGSDILTMFAKYYDLVRRLILVYNLEPAGSHGVWGLDDHFHFIYILGAAQFNANDTKYIPPVLQVLSPQTISAYKDTNLYVNAIAFIFKIKLGPFQEHSPIIYDIHKSVSLWAKVLSGLLKMYEVEVFGKFPVVQHFWFGSGLFPWVHSDSLKDLPIRQEMSENNDEKSDDTLPGFINGFTGTRTTKANITLTGAPWARQDATKAPPRPRGTGLSGNRNYLGQSNRGI